MKAIVKGKKGFTLVEVIVVAVIVAILAAVAVPLYMGYIRDSRKNVANNVAGSLASYLGAAVASGGTFAAVSDANAVPNLGTGNAFTIPTDVTVTYTASTSNPGTVVAKNGDQTSDTYYFAK